MVDGNYNDKKFFPFCQQAGRPTASNLKPSGKRWSGRRDSKIALFTESGFRLSELVNIEPEDIDWDSHTVRIVGKGRKEAVAPFGRLAEQYLKDWLGQYQPDANIWDLNRNGITSMLRRREESTGIPCSPRVFR